MRWRRRDRPAWVRALNAAGRGLAAGGLAPPSLAPERLLAAARRRCGLEDFGEDGFREPFTLFVESLEREAELTPIGRLLARHEVGTLLDNRLRIQETFRKTPGIAARPLRRPIFVTGTGRSGTSILHELLAQDPALRALLSWEALRPCPAAPGDEARRIRAAERELRSWERIAPAYRTMHENGARVPQECIYLTAHAFASDLLAGSYAVPSYAAWLGRADLRGAYRTHARILRILQGEEPVQWVLKAPSHLWSLAPLLAVYPDARIVQTHRDPLAVLASMTTLMTTLLWLRSDRVDPVRIGRRALASIASMLERSMAQRDAGLLAPDRVCDVRYADFMADPIACVAGVYAHFGLPFRAEAESRMRAYLAAKPQARHGAHRYRFEDTGLDLDALRERFAPYRERFGVAAEA